VPIFTTGLLSGYASTILLDLVGLQRRGLLKHGWVLALTPLHWFLLSLAAWRAVFQLMYDPQGWEKTEHGLAKSSRADESRNAASSHGQELRQEPTVGTWPQTRPNSPVAPIGPAVPIAPIRMMHAASGRIFESAANSVRAMPHI